MLEPLPPYQPDPERVSTLVGVAAGGGPYLSEHDVYVLDYLSLCSTGRPEGLTLEEISQAVAEGELSLYPRLLGLESFGLVKQGLTTNGLAWRLTSAGQQAVIALPALAPLGPRLRQSGLA